MPIFYFYAATLSLFLGIFVATFWSFSLPLITWLVLIGFITILVWYRSLSGLEFKSGLILGLIIITFSLGALRLEIASWSFGNSLLEVEVGKTVAINGVVAKEPDIREKAVNLEIQTDNDLVLVSVDKYQKVAYGDMVSVKGKLAKPESFETDLGRVFNYPGYLKAKGIEYKISFASVEVLESGQGNKIVSTLLTFKHFFMSKLEENIREPAAGLGEGLLLGVKQSLGEDLEAAFRKTGIIHIVVLSGYNIMLVVIFVLYILGHFLSKKPKVIIGILAIAAFAVLVGLSATVVRASVMAGLLLLVQTSGRTYIVLRGLMLAGLVMVLINPYLIAYDVGFHLSFLATLGLILISPHFEELFFKVSNILGIRSFLVATLSTQIAVLPILLYQIGEFSVVAVIVNILVLPMVPVAMLLTFLTGIAAIISSTLATFIAIPTYFSLIYITQVAWWFSQLPFAAFSVPAFSFFSVPILYAAIGFILWLVYKKGLVHESTLSDWTIEEDEDAENKPVAKVGATQNVAPTKTTLPLFENN
jgi:competence protein ComEC